ncbi:hypothetical protein BH11MYX3_BH11MYX3_30580 [soil metagenome]
MRNLSSFRLFPILLALSFGTACTDDSGDPPKLVSVANQTNASHRVQFGNTDMGSIAARATSTYLEVEDGTQAVLVDGHQVWRDSLGSDNVGGSWTLYLQSVGSQLTVGVSADD